MSLELAYRDAITGRRYAIDALRWCSDEGKPLDLEFTPRGADLAAMRAHPPGLWRYRDALPFDAAARPVTLGEGQTPLVSVQLDGAAVLLKQDHALPTGSYKDRGASVLITAARSLGVKRLIQDSSGNAGAAVAAYAARAGIACTIYVPEGTSPAKLVQMRAVGAEVVRVPGSREDTARAARAAAGEAFYASHCWNPFFLHGTKTFAYEVFDQLGGRAPDAIVLPVGNGTLLLGAALGFEELRASGLIAHAPALWGVQSSLCCPVADAFAGRTARAPSGTTLAEGIAIAEPPRLTQMVDALQRSGGGALVVSDAEVEAAWREIAAAGFYVEPTSAATLAGFAKARTSIAAGATVIVPITGSGLKATDKIAHLLDGH